MKAGMKVVRTDQEIECPFLDNALRESGAELLLLPGSVDESRLVDHMQDVDLLLVCYTPVTSLVINEARKLKGIVKYGVGIDAIDVDSAKLRRVPVVNIPAYAQESVAEGAFSMMISLAKKLIPIHNAMEKKGWIWPESKWLGSDIAGKTLGLIGVGRIGCSMARMAGAGFRAKVLGYDPNVSQETMLRAGVEKREEILTMLSECDFVSVHCVLNEDTRHLIGHDEFQSMKSSVILINTARGAIIDETELINAIENGKIAGAGLDVFSKEPLNKGKHPFSRLYGLDNVILMPHLTFYSGESMRRLEKETLERCLELLEDRPVIVKSTDPRLVSQRHGVRFPIAQRQEN